MDPVLDVFVRESLSWTATMAFKVLLILLILLYYYYYYYYYCIMDPVLDVCVREPIGPRTTATLEMWREARLVT